MPTSLRPLPTPATPASAPPSPSLLRPAPDLDDALDFDRLQRYSVAARLIDRLCAGSAGPVRVLEVGGRVRGELPRFLVPDRTEVVYGSADEMPDEPEH